MYAFTGIDNFFLHCDVSVAVLVSLVFSGADKYGSFHATDGDTPSVA